MSAGRPTHSNQIDEAIVLRAPFYSFQRRAGQGSNDGIVELDAAALNEEAIVAGEQDIAANFLGGGLSSSTLPVGAFVSKITTPSENSVVSSASVNVETAPVLTVAAGASVEIAGVSAQSVAFAGNTGTLKLDDSLAFTGQVSGLAGSDAIDLVNVSYGTQTQATFLGDTSGGTLTITDGIHTANITLQGDYLSSTWTLSSDGNGGTVVVDPVASNNWQELKIGAGGYLDGIDVAPDGTMVVRTDTYGAYIWNGTEWQQLVTSTSMPAAFVAANFGNTGQGVYEIQIAPSSTNILYMQYLGYVFKSADKGTTWTQTNFSQVTTDNPNDAVRGNGQKMAIDPNNPNIVYVGTEQNGLFVTTNGGTTWQNVSAVPVGLVDSNGNYPGITGILFDPALGVTGGNTNTIFASSSGNGVYESTNGGASWTHLSGGPTDVEYAAVSSTGAYYVAGNSGSTLWRYMNGAWTELLNSYSGWVQSVAVNPLNPSEIAVQSTGGDLNVSYDGGATWSGYANVSAQMSSTDIPWLASTGSWLSTSAAAFNPLVPNQLIDPAGIGVWTTNVPQNLATSPIPNGSPVIDWDSQFNESWNSQSAGIEQLVANQIIVPPGGKPVLASWDRAFFYVANPNAFPTSFGPVSGAFAGGWSLDYASSSPNFIVGIAESNISSGEESGYSTDGGQTWTKFASMPAFVGQGAMGGTIAASSPTDIVWAPANGFQPYYTLNGGTTWNPVNLPGVSSYTGFDFAYYLNAKTVTADRVLANTFYLYDAGAGVFRSTNGGATWTEVFSGQISATSYLESEIESVPGEASNLFFTGGPQTGTPSEPFMRSTNGGTTWTAVSNVLNVSCFGFGASATSGGYPAIYIVGYVNNVYGVWQSNNNAQSWTQIGTYPENSLDQITTISGDPNIYGQVYVGFRGSGYAYLPAAPAGPTITGVTESPSTGDLNAGKTVTLTLTLSSAATVAGGTPTLTLNDGGTATYTGGSGTTALTFGYTVGASDTNVGSLSATAVNLNGATINDGSGNAANLGLSGVTQTGPQIDTSTVITAISETPSTGDLNAGKTVTYTLTMNEIVTVNTSGGSPTLALNDGGTATYVSGSGSSTLTFSYTVQAGQNTPDLMVSSVSLNGATVTDGAGNAASLSLSGLSQGSPQIDTTAPTVSSVSATAGSYNSGKTITLTLNTSEAVSVTGTPTLTLNDGGTATYTGGSGTNALTFSYTVGAGQNTAGLAVTAVGGTIADLAGNALSTTNLPETFTGVVVDTTTPSVSSVVASGTGITAGSGDLGVGSVVTLTVNISEAVTVTGGTPTLTLNDGGTATYTGGSGTNALTFSYTVAAGQNTSDLAVTAVNLNSATVKNGAGTAASLTGAVTNPSGTLQIDTTGPTVSSVVTSGSGITSGSGDLAAGSVVTLTLNMSEAVTVNTTDGTPTLTLNDGGTATYTGGSGTNALTFSYTVAAGQNTSDLAVTAINLNSATVTGGAGTTASLSGAVTNPSGTLQIDTTTPSVSSVVASGTGITSGSGDLAAGSVVTLTLNMSEAVTVNTTGGTPTLTLNDGGTATYTGGSGTNALTFSYTVAAGQNTSDLAVTAVNLNSATVKNGAGTAASLTGAVTNPSGTLQIDTTTPSVSSMVTSGTGITSGTGDLGIGSVVTLTVNLSEAVTVTGGTPTLTLNDGGTATYSGGSGTNALTFTYTVTAGQNTSDLTVTAVNLNSATVTGGAGTAASLAGAVTNPAGTLQIDTTTPTLNSISETPANGHLKAGKTVTLTLNMSEAVTVTGGTPTLTLNDGATATYTGGSGTNTLTFSYTVGSGQNVNSLAATVINLNGATVKNGAGTAANFPTLSGLTQVGAQIDTMTPTVTQVVASPGSGTENPGNVVTLTLDMSEAVTVTGTPTLTLNDGGTATYVGGSGTNALTFSYTVGAADSTVPTLAITQANLPSGATVTDAAGNVADLSGAVTTFPGLSIDPPPIVVSVAETPPSGDLGVGKIVTLTLTLNDVVTVTGGIPSLALNDGGIATYMGGSGTNALTFTYMVAAGQNAASLAATGLTLNGAMIQNSLGNQAIFSFNGVTQTGPQIDTTTPTVTSVAASGAGITAGSGDLPSGSVVTLTVDLSEAVTVAGGTPTLTLNNGGTATYMGGSGTNALTFSYTVALGQNTSDLAVTAFNQGSATIANGAGTAANMSGVTTSISGTLQIDTTTHVAQVGNDYFLDNVNNAGPELKYGGTPFTAQQVTTGWTIVGAAQTASGYDVAFKNAATDQFSIWNTDSNGNFVSYNVYSGNSTALEALETTFHQDLNGDGTIGLPPPTVIQTDGTTSLVISGGDYFLNTVGSSSLGPELQYGGAAYSAQQVTAGWAIIGAVQTASGYDVAFKNAATDQLSIWNTNSNGNFVSYNVYSGNSTALEGLENTFQQDLNGDGVIGIYAAPGTTLQVTIPLSGPSGSATIGAAATLELGAANSSSVTFASSTGMLELDQPSTFDGVIYGFTGNGTLSGSDQIDLKGINFNNVHDSYSNGVLTVTDGTNTAALDFNGSYTLANFSFATDGKGGTILYDPPVTAGQQGTLQPQIMQDPGTSALNQQVALFSQQIAAAFPASAPSDSGSATADAPNIGGAQLAQIAAPFVAQQHA